jgi:hypothetical protein
MILDDPDFQDYEKYMVGFTWEEIWGGHPWKLEQLYFEELEKKEAVTIIR